jgi:hypothetical protein
VTTAVPRRASAPPRSPAASPSDSRAGRRTISAVRMKKKASPRRAPGRPPLGGSARSVGAWRSSRAVVLGRRRPAGRPGRGGVRDNVTRDVAPADVAVAVDVRVLGCACVARDRATLSCARAR